MARFRYVGDHERVLLGPPVRVVSPGETLEAASNPDPALFCEIPVPILPARGQVSATSWTGDDLEERRIADVGRFGGLGE